MPSPKSRTSIAPPDEWLKPHRCPRFEPGRKARPHESGTGKFVLERRCQHSPAPSEILSLDRRGGKWELPASCRRPRCAVSFELGRVQPGEARNYRQLGACTRLTEAAD